MSIPKDWDESPEKVPENILIYLKADNIIIAIIILLNKFVLFM